MKLVVALVIASRLAPTITVPAVPLTISNQR